MISWRQLILLLGVRIRILLRLHAGGRRRRWAFVLATLMTAGLGAWLALTLDRMLEPLDRHATRELVHLLFLGIGVWMVTAPLLGFRATEHLDPGRLLSFPVSSATLYVSAWLGSLLGLQQLLLLPGLVVLAVHVSSGPGALVASLTVILLFQLAMQAIAQTVVLILLNVLRSRRFSDLMIVISPIIGIGIYLLARTVLDAHLRGDFIAVLSQTDLAGRLAGVPTSWFAQLLLPDTDVSASLIHGALAGGLLIVFIALGSRLQRAACYGEIHLGTPRKGTRSRAARRRLRPSLFPEDIRAICVKELRTLSREPLVRTTLVQQMAVVFLPLLIPLASGNESESTTSAFPIVPFAIWLLYSAEAMLLLNNLGIEGAGVRQLAVYPITRGRILAGKNLAHYAVFLPINIVLTAIMLVLEHLVQGSDLTVQFLERWPRYVVVHSLVLIVFLSVGNLTSPLLPIRLVARSRRVASQAGTARTGCTTTLLRVSLWLGTLVLAAPVAAAILLPPPVPFSLSLPFYYAIVVPLLTGAIVTGWAFSLMFGDRLFRRREPDIVAALAPES